MSCTRAYVSIPLLAALLVSVPGAPTRGAPLEPAEVADTTLFAHMAIGGGYTTVFTFLNTGADNVTGNLVLTDQKGNPLSADLDGSLSSSMPLSIPPGGTTFVTAGPVNADDPVKTGWAKVESSGGTLGGVATFQVVENGLLTTIAGVLSSKTVKVATIPLDDDIPGDRYTGFAIANPGSAAIIVSVQTVKADGTPDRVLTSMPLGAGEQKAAFVFESAGYQAFQGSVVLIGQNEAEFAVVALVQDSRLLTVVPVIPAKAPAIN